MNSAQKTNKKISEYQIEDLKGIFNDFIKRISSKVILLEIGNNFINIGLAKSQKNKLYIKKILSQKLPEEALEKSIPSDALSFGSFLKQIISENKINTNRVALSLPSDACYTRLVEIPDEIDEKASNSFIENPDSGIQIPISLDNSDFDIRLTNLPKKKIKNKSFNKYFLTSLPKKNVDIILDSIKSANLEICSMQMSHMCIANLLKSEINKLNDDELMISVDLLDEFTQFVIFDKSGPLSIKRLASIRNFPSIEEMKKINNSNDDKSKKSKMQDKSRNYHALSKLDVKILLREINQSFTDFLDKHNLDKKGKIFLSGRNSQHKNLVELIGKSLKMDVALISPVNNSFVKEFSYNPDEINQFSMARVIGLGLTLIKGNGSEDDLLNRDFIAQQFFFNKYIKESNKKDIEDSTVSDLMDSLDKLNQVNSKVKADSKAKSEEKKKELPPLPNLKIKEQSGSKAKGEGKKKELPPLPNLKIKEQSGSKAKGEEKKKELPPLPNLKIKEQTDSKAKSEEKKKELPPLPNLKIKEQSGSKAKGEEKKKELPPLPNLKKSDRKTNNKDALESEDAPKKQKDNPEIKKNKSFKMDSSFLKND